MDIDIIFDKLKRYNLEGFSHTDFGLIGHLKGTYEILKNWKCSDELCMAGLCHSIYGTESYRKDPIDLSERDNIRSIIGEESERIAYLFGAHVKDSLWENLDRVENFRIFDRLESKEVSIERRDLQDLITLTLANWLEQRPRAPEEYKFIRKNEFLRSEDYLPKAGHEAFKVAYQC